jgi:hypothetical protein
MGFEPTISASERAKTIHALDRAATAIGPLRAIVIQNSKAEKTLVDRPIHVSL